MSKKIHVQTTINGEAVEFLCEPRQSLLECLRDIVGLTGTKEGCNDGNCGACTIILDGRTVTSCLVLGVEVEGKEAVRELLAVTTQIWTTIDQNSGDTIYLGVTGSNENGDWKILLSWGDATYANEATSITLPYHQATWFTEDNLISRISGLYDRTELVASYEEDPIK